LARIEPIDLGPEIEIDSIRRIIADFNLIVVPTPAQGKQQREKNQNHIPFHSYPPSAEPAKALFAKVNPIIPFINHYKILLPQLPLFFFGLQVTLIFGHIRANSYIFIAACRHKVWNSRTSPAFQQMLE
jgi:hypothetical protein